MSPEVAALAAKLEAAFAGGDPAALSDDAVMLALVRSELPAAADPARAGAKAADAEVAAARVSLGNALRLACQRLTRRALAAGDAPMRWAPGGGAVLPAFLDCAYELCSAGYGDSPVALVMGLLEDISEAVGGDECRDTLDWLLAREERIRSARDSRMPALKLCNRVLSRLSRASEPQLCAAVLVYLAKVFPLQERSGLNLSNALLPALITAPEEVPPGAADSSGQPVDALLYAATWGLQPLLHSPKDVVSPDAWAKFVADVRTVLAALASQPAQVAAGAGGANGGHGAGGGMELDGGGGGGGGGAGGEGTVGYLSSPQLFGLQLRDATFRRDLLVQVLILLQAVQKPVKGPTELRPKQLNEAQALEGEVYAALEQTPSNGKAFAAAVRSLLQREQGWAQWKRGGPPPRDPPKDKAAAAQCPDYALKPLAPGLGERVAEGAAAAAAAEARTQSRREAILAALAREKRSTLEMDTEEMMAPRKRVKTDSEVLRNVSRLDTWVYHVPDDNMGGLKVTERPAFPTLELLARPTLEQMDPESCVEAPYRLCRTDPVYRWRMARLMARRWPGSMNVSPLPEWMPQAAYKDRLTTAAPDEIELMLSRILPDMVPEAWKAEELAKRAEERAAADAAKADKAGGGAASGDKPPTRPGTADGGSAGGGGRGGVKKEEGEADAEGVKRDAGGGEEGAADGADGADAGGAGGGGGGAEEGEAEEGEAAGGGGDEEGAAE